MNVLRYLLWLPFIAIILLLLLALFFPSVKMESNYSINATVIDTWNFFHDKSKMHLWMDGFKRAQLIQEMPNNIGSKYVLYFQKDGNDMQMNQTITEFEIYKKFGFKVEHPGAISNNIIEFNESEGKTNIKQKIEMKPSSFFFRPVLPIVKIAMRQQSEKNYDKLKKLIEEEFKDK